MTQHRVLQGRILTEAGWMDGELKLAPTAASRP